MSIFRSLKYYNFRLHVTGQSVSLIGTWMQRVAISWLVYRLTGSPFLLGVVTFASLIPSLLLSPYTGSYTDRHNKYKILIYTQVGLMVQAGLLAALVWFKYYDMTLIIILSLLQGIINAFDTTARQSLMVDLIQNKDDLPNAIALNSSVFNAARLVGPAVAGIILSTLGEDACFIINFLSFIAVLISLSFMKLNLARNSKPTENIWTGLKQGYNYLEASPDLSSLIIMLAASSLLIIPFTTLLPVFAKDLFNGDATVFSWFESAAGLGALIGAIYMATLKHSKDLMKITIYSGAIFAIGVLMLSYSTLLPIALICTVAAGVGMMAQTSSINTYIQTHAASNMRGRAISYYIMAFQGVLPLGSLLAGYMAHHLGTRLTVSIEGIAGIMIIGAFVLYQKRLKQQTSTAH